MASRGGRLCETEAAPRLPNLRIERHDIVRDELPTAHFHLFHARLVLIHIPERDAVLERLIAALRPLPTADAMRIYMARGGVDARSGRLLHGKFRALGHAEVAAEGRMLMFDRANGGTEIMRVNFEQVGAKLAASGLIEEEQLHADLARLSTARRRRNRRVESTRDCDG